MAQGLYGYAQQEVTILTTFLLVFTHERTYEQLFLLTMQTTNKHRYKNKLLGYYFCLHGGKHGEKSVILSLKISHISSASSA